MKCSFLLISILGSDSLRQVAAFSSTTPSSSISSSPEIETKWLTNDIVVPTDSVKSSVHDREWTKLSAVKQWWTDDDDKDNAIFGGETVKLQKADFIPSLWGLKGVPESIVTEPKGGDDHVRFVVYNIGGTMTDVLSVSCNKQFPLIPHVGIRIYGTEWFYSDHVESRPSEVMLKMLNPDTYPQCEFDLGPTTRTAEEIADWLSDAQDRYNKETYNLWERNCNHFAKEMSSFLLPNSEAGIPEPIIGPVIDFTDSMLDNLPEWRRAAGNYFMDKLSRMIVVSWGGVVKKEKKRLKEELKQQAAAAESSDS